MPEEEYTIELTPLTFSVLLGKENSLKWPLPKSKQILHTRDCSFDRGIDVFLRDPAIGEKLENKNVLELLSVTDPPSNERLIEEVANIILTWFGSLNLNVVSVNHDKPKDLWLGLGRELSRKNDRHKGSWKATRLDNRKARDASVEINKNRDGTYILIVNVSDVGEMSAEIYFKYGYWLARNIKTADF